MRYIRIIVSIRNRKLFMQEGSVFGSVFVINLSAKEKLLFQSELISEYLISEMI
jgi:hypothetical protein